MLELGKLTSSAELHGGDDDWLGPGKPFWAISGMITCGPILHEGNKQSYTTELFEAILW